MKSIKGMVTIKATGEEMERFFNLCINKNIVIREIIASDNATCFTISAKDYLTLKPVLQKTHTRTVLLRKSGLPFFCVKLKKRWMFIIAIFFCTFILINVLSRIWRIELTGNESISFEQFYGFLNTNNIKYGTYSKNIDYKQLEASIREYFPQVTWASVTLEGTGLCIVVKEDLSSYKNEKQTFENSHLIATREGVIVNMVVRQGVSTVKIGDTIAPGDILVQGNIPIYNDDLTIKNELLINADADIWVRYNESIHLTLNEKYINKKYTQESKKNYYIQLGNFRIWNPFHNTSYKNSHSTTAIKQFKLIDKYYLPLYFGIKNTKEYIEEDAKYTLDEAKNILNEELEEILATLSQKGVQIIEKNVNIFYEGKMYHLTCELILEEQAVSSIPIVINGE